jgi:sulfatase maturation enzyme AslB (radical SAM superfamily)
VDMPIFTMPLRGHSIWYCAGKLWILTPEESSRWQFHFKTDAPINWDNAPHVLQQLRCHALDSQKRYDMLFTQRFCPECLTVYISYDCDLHCSYCYTRKHHGTVGLMVDLAHVEASARCVAQACQRKRKDFVLVLHGGGEPTYHWSHMQAVYRTVRAVASEYDLQLHCYIATNGLFDQEQAVWLAKNIRHIGLSCDGPPDIQAKQRHSLKWPSPMETIKKNAKTILEAGGRLDVRATITPESSPYQSDIVIFLSEELGARMIRFEPVYGQNEAGFTVRHADRFAHDFLLAQRVARERDCTLLYSGVRLQDLHSTYCDVLRDTIRLLPEGILSSCFYHSVDQLKPLLQISEYDCKKQRFDVAHDHVAQVRHLISRRPNKCSACINQLHCSMGCPDCCAIYTPHVHEDFRCRLNHQLTLNWILEAAEKALSDEHGQRMGIPVECC